MSDSIRTREKPPGFGLISEVRRHSAGSPWTYFDLDRRQKEVRMEIARGGPGRLILSELPPTITLGMRETREDLLAPESELRERGISLVVASRGGRATYHGPGQWVVFPVDSLERMTGDRRGVRKLVDALLEIARELCAERFPRAEIRSGKEAGVWTESGPAGAKLVALGVRIEDGVVQHGLAVNVQRTPESFVGLRPCGLESPIGFLEPSASESAFVEWGNKIAAAFVARD